MGCAASTANSPALGRTEETLARGGELAGEAPDRSIRIDGDSVSIWGTTEVPDGSRLQLAFSGVDAIARAELLKAVRVRVQSLMVDVESNDPKARSLTLTTTESVSGVLDRAGPLPHGWARIQRGDEQIIRLWARLRVSRAALEAALREPLASSGHDASTFVAGLRSVADTTP